LWRTVGATSCNTVSQAGCSESDCWSFWDTEEPKPSHVHGVYARLLPSPPHFKAPDAPRGLQVSPLFSACGLWTPGDADWLHDHRVVSPIRLNNKILSNSASPMFDPAGSTVLWEQLQGGVATATKEVVHALREYVSSTTSTFFCRCQGICTRNAMVCRG